MDGRHTIEVAACKVDFDAYTKAINSAENDIKKQNFLIEMDTPVRDDRVKELTSKHEELVERKTRKDELNTARKAQIELYNSVVAEHNMVRGMLHKARRIMEDQFKSTEGEFLQTNVFM